ncbi:WhiB family transcriptional regulator [Nonomuraea rhizosphaerae]|uniref:WhiB family transcriptional regulator n=1 Tax=Nonomuraea rhizosphaerae TaxID=2665663 RepID=UPI001C5E1995|nr:WhiB family transcriptional regulator [Nonomuraea rhizosphaerae]
MNELAAVVLGDEKLSDLRDDVINADPACESGDAELFTGPDLFEPESDDERNAREAKAKGVCGGCPARAACLIYALAALPEVGVWAGLTANELRGLREVAA